MKTWNTENWARKIRGALFALFCAWTMLCGTAVAQTAVVARTTEPYASARESADRQAKEWIARGIPGLALAVAVDGKIVY
jgi:CubicO group peptidase (beta-lactamase class C family)